MQHYSVLLDDHEHIVRVSGDIDLAAVETLRGAVDQVRTFPASSAVVLDLAEVTFLDASGLGELVRPAADRADVVLRRPSPPVCKVLELTGLTGMFTIVAEPGRS
jgi:anti-anti-sigma factor